MARKVVQRTWPDPAVVRSLLHSAAWLVFVYMLLLSLFELIELLRPKALPCRCAAPPPPRPLCPDCAARAARPNRTSFCILL